MEVCDFDGIEIASYWPEYYLDLHNLALARYFPQGAAWPAVETALRQLHRRPAPALASYPKNAVDWEALPYLLGWHSPDRLEQLIHREWLDQASNEFGAHEAIFAGIPALHDSAYTVVAGAGVCRFAHWLVQQSSTIKVLCSDLSLLALAAGRLLLRGQAHELPLPLRQPCEIVQQNGPQALVFAEAPLRYLPGTAANDRLAFRASDCYALTSIADADTLALLYVLDVPPFFDTMLVRLTEHLRVGQRLVFLTNVTARRDPRLILATLAALGLRTEHVEVRELPYSLSRHDFAFTRALCPTLVVQAVVERPFDPNGVRVYPTAPLETMVELLGKRVFPDQKSWPVALGDFASAQHKSAILRNLQSAFADKPYLRFRQILSDAFGPAALEPLITYLCARCMAMLTCVRGKA